MVRKGIDVLWQHDVAKHIAFRVQLARAHAHSAKPTSALLPAACRVTRSHTRALANLSQSISAVSVPRHSVQIDPSRSPKRRSSVRKFVTVSLKWIVAKPSLPAAAILS